MSLYKICHYKSISNEVGTLTNGRSDDGDGQVAALLDQHVLGQRLREGVRVGPITCARKLDFTALL